MRKRQQTNIHVILNAVKNLAVISPTVRRQADAPNDNIR
jgi:hypothetical protein